MTKYISNYIFNDYLKPINISFISNNNLITVLTSNVKYFDNLNQYDLYINPMNGLHIKNISGDCLKQIFLESYTYEDTQQINVFESKQLFPSINIQMLLGCSITDNSYNQLCRHIDYFLGTIQVKDHYIKQQKSINNRDQYQLDKLITYIDPKTKQLLNVNRISMVYDNMIGGFTYINGALCFVIRYNISKNTIDQLTNNSPIYEKSYQIDCNDIIYQIYLNGYLCNINVILFSNHFINTLCKKVIEYNTGIYTIND